jgi:hypothetical protein
MHMRQRVSCSKLLLHDNTRCHIQGFEVRQIAETRWNCASQLVAHQFPTVVSAMLQHGLAQQYMCVCVSYTDLPSRPDCQCLQESFQSIGCQTVACVSHYVRIAKCESVAETHTYSLTSFDRLPMVDGIVPPNWSLL